MQTGQCDGFISDRLQRLHFLEKESSRHQGVVGAIRGDGSWVVDRDPSHVWGSG